VGIYELLEMNKTIHDLVLSRASADAIQEAGIASGMQTLLEDGVRKVLAGNTTFEEVLRVTRAR
jgi:type II secretory ATPase GspE/PulE/Tfp pilus assembly ATPase PilB-like protein